MIKNNKAILKSIYNKLFDAFGPQHWWPAKTKFEVMVGAILTQNTNWGNVKRALNNLKEAKQLSFKALMDTSNLKLASLIKPAGYYNIKAKRLKNFIDFFAREYKGSIKKMQAEDSRKLRKSLLGVNGIGPETADSILLYAIESPIFVVDAYTRRIFSRHGLVGDKDNYDLIQNLFMDNLEVDVEMFNEYHALIVRLAKEHCKARPNCDSCPLGDLEGSIR